MKKLIFLTSIVIGVLVMVNFALSQDKPKEEPFKAIWEAINYLQEQIDGIELLSGPQGPEGPQGPAGLSIFPLPKFDSDWISIPSQMAVIDIPHDVGGDINDYFIEATYRRHNGSFTSHQTAADRIWWEDVEPNNIQLITNGDVTNEFEAARIRIWVVGQ